MFCIFINNSVIIFTIVCIISITNSISITFPVLLKCLYLTCKSFCPFLLPIPLGERGQVSDELSSAQLPDARLNYNTSLQTFKLKLFCSVLMSLVTVVAAEPLEKT